MRSLRAAVIKLPTHLGGGIKQAANIYGKFLGVIFPGFFREVWDWCNYFMTFGWEETKGGPDTLTSTKTKLVSLEDCAKMVRTSTLNDVFGKQKAARKSSSYFNLSFLLGASSGSSPVQGGPLPVNQL